MAQNNILMNFKEKDNQVKFIGKYMEVYIPYKYLESNMARIVEDRVETLGIFLYRIYKSEDKKDSSPMKIYKLPNIITTKPSSNRVDKLSINGETENYLVLEYYENDVFIDSTIIVQDGSFVNDFINYYHGGNIPNFIKYEDTIVLEVDCITINKMKFPVPLVLLECINSEINRDAKDLSKPFRFSACKGANSREYKPMSIKQLPSFNSTFTSLTFEDIDYQLVSSVNKTRYNKKEIISPIEETIKY